MGKGFGWLRNKEGELRKTKVKNGEEAPFLICVLYCHTNVEFNLHPLNKDRKEGSTLHRKTLLPFRLCKKKKYYLR